MCGIDGFVRSFDRFVADGRFRDAARDGKPVRASNDAR